MDATQRLLTAIATIPNGWAWLYAANLLILYSLIALPIGFKFNFLHIEIVGLPPVRIWGLLIICLLSPAITEEIVFRVLLLPHTSENYSPAHLALWGSVSLAIFILYHPLNALSFYSAGQKAFFNPVFLTLAAILGIACTLSYWQSGSLWPPVAIHWLVVVAWLTLLGGYKKLNS
jgi:predicted Abi (CAAX) family protease